MERHPEVDIVGGQVEVFSVDDDGGGGGDSSSSADSATTTTAAVSATTPVAAVPGGGTVVAATASCQDGGGSLLHPTTAASGSASTLSSASAPSASTSASASASLFSRSAAAATPRPAASPLVEPLLGRRTTCFPQRPRRVHWKMLFSCCVAHPTVMFRRKALARWPFALLEGGGGGGGGRGEGGGSVYRESPIPPWDHSSAPPGAGCASVAHVEDYELWLRVLEGVDGRQLPAQYAAAAAAAAANASPATTSKPPTKSDTRSPQATTSQRCLRRRRACDERRAIAIANLNSVVVRLRKHVANVSTTHAAEQQRHRAEVGVVDVCVGSVHARRWTH